MGEQDKIRIIIDNLISNAVKYTPFGGSIDLRSFADCKMGVFEIADSGPGIPEEERGKIFQPFYQGEAPLNGIIKGTGLGLSIAKEYVLEQGGRISVKNSRSGGGLFPGSLSLGKRGTEGMKIIKKAGIPAVSIWLLVVLSGCLPGTYYGGKNCFGDKWEAVVEKDAPRRDVIFPLLLPEATAAGRTGK